MQNETAYFRYKPIELVIFQGGGSGPPIPLSGSAHVLFQYMWVNLTE